jgi:hypothetical protein
MILAAAWNKLVIQLCTRHTSHENPIKRALLIQRRHVITSLVKPKDKNRLVAHKLKDFCCFIKHLAKRGYCLFLQMCVD